MTADQPNASLCLVQAKSHRLVLVVCPLRAAQVHLGNAEIIPFLIKMYSVRFWEHGDVWNIRSLLNAIYICHSSIVFFFLFSTSEYRQSCVCWEFSQNQYGFHEAASVCHGFLVQRTAKSSVFGTWGRLSFHGLHWSMWTFSGLSTTRGSPTFWGNPLVGVKIHVTLYNPKPLWTMALVCYCVSPITQASIANETGTIL